MRKTGGQRLGAAPPDSLSAVCGHLQLGERMAVQTPSMHGQSAVQFDRDERAAYDTRRQALGSGRVAKGAESGGPGEWIRVEAGCSCRPDRGARRASVGLRPRRASVRGAGVQQLLRADDSHLVPSSLVLPRSPAPTSHPGSLSLTSASAVQPTPSPTHPRPLEL